MKRPFRILIADKKANVRDFLHRELTRAGYDTTIARNGYDLGAALSNPTPPDLILLDPDLPYLEPGPALEWFVKRLTSIPIVLHAYDAGDCTHPLARGAAARVEKDGTMDALKEAVRLALEHTAKGGAPTEAVESD